MTVTSRSGDYPRAFTLVELLAVMAVISLLLALTLPALNGFSQSNSLSSGGDMITNLVALARQTSTSKNTLTALVLLGNQGSVDSDYRAFTVLQYDLALQRWVQNTPWQSLPTGVVVDFTDTANCTFMANSPYSFPDLGAGQGNPPVLYQQKGVTSYAARIFIPNGGLLNAQDPAQIRLVEGAFQRGQLIYTHHQKSVNAPSNYYDVAILGATGQTKVSRP